MLSIVVVILFLRNCCIIYINSFMYSLQDWVNIFNQYNIIYFCDIIPTIISFIPISFGEFHMFCIVSLPPVPPPPSPHPPNKKERSKVHCVEFKKQQLKQFVVLLKVFLVKELHKDVCSAANQKLLTRIATIKIREFCEFWFNLRKFKNTNNFFWPTNESLCLQISSWRLKGKCFQEKL